MSGWLGLTRYRVMLAGVVESTSAKNQISALLDLVDLYLSGQGTAEGIALLLYISKLLRQAASNADQVRALYCGA